MYIGVAQFIINIQPYVLPVIMAIVSLVVGVVFIVSAVKLIRKQVKLHNSISLVELKNFKAHYWVFIFLIAFFIIYIIMQMADSMSPEIVNMQELLNMHRWQTNIMLGSLLGLMVTAEVLLVCLARFKCAVVDRGVYIGMNYLDWYHVHDYIIDEDKGHVVLSSNKYTFATLCGTTPPLKVAKNDIPKLKFILNKNKNKFSSFNDDSFK